MTEREIFVAALHRSDPAERGEFLDRACHGDQGLRDRVEELLAEHDRLGSFLDRPAVAPPQGDDAPTATVPPLPEGREAEGSTLGPYKLLQVLGEGGMGTVYMADQFRPIRRRVALKVVKAGMDSRQVLARFEAERQALALMNHPNIARVLDAGTTPAGRPYFVMELVKGLPLTSFCDEQNLPVADRLRVFQQVCHAVQHAHQKGVIHRDLKPSNVLVESHEGRPVPKVIDFGLAKAVGAASLTDRSLFTHFGAALGTPLYMAPEQAELGALDVDTRADVYALGVILYELLTGTTPIERRRLAAAAWDEIRRIIKEEQPPTPSARLSTAEGRASVAALRQTEPGRLGRTVRGDLDWVVMKALAKERDRRYESAGAFAADVERFLNQEPVSAGPPTTAYRLRRFARRNRAALAAAGLVLLFLVLLGVGAGWVYRDRAAREERVLQDQLARQAAVDQEATSALRESEALLRRGESEEALSAAKRAEGILAGGGSEALRARAKSWRDDVQMAMRLEAMRTSPEGVVSYAERAAGYKRAFREYGIDVDALGPTQIAGRIAARSIRPELVVALDYWAYELRLAGTASEREWRRLFAAARAADPDEWRNRVRDALEHRQPEVVKAVAASPDIGRLPLSTLDLLGTALSGAGGTEDIEFFRAVQRRYPDDFSVNFKLAWVLDHQREAHREEALRFYTAALALRPRNRPAQTQITSALIGLGRVEEAMSFMRQVAAIDPNADGILGHLGLELRHQGKFDEAVACFKQAIELNPRSPFAHYELGICFEEQGKPDEAVASFEKEIELNPTHARGYIHLSVALRRLGRSAEAIAREGEALALGLEAIARNPGRMDPDYHNNLAWWMANDLGPGRRDPARAVALARRAVELVPDQPLYSRTLGAACYRAGDWRAAIAALERTLELSGGGDGREWFLLAMAYQRLGEREKARAWYDRATRWMDETRRTDDTLRRLRAEAVEVLDVGPAAAGPTGHDGG